jgi:hypothetical protein
VNGPGGAGAAAATGPRSEKGGGGRAAPCREEGPAAIAPHPEGGGGGRAALRCVVGGVGGLVLPGEERGAAEPLRWEEGGAEERPRSDEGGSASSSGGADDTRARPAADGRR